MSHEEVLNEILSNACIADYSKKHPGATVHTIELCCAEFAIHATHNLDKPFTYTIHELERLA